MLFISLFPVTKPG